ncbi:hypothetical protein CYY_009936 [Polysphondylium violaceum]|uniref:Uncharacterized protein n=1 Tax=Polysphondylium violaceum TaxID=133409 RepID=A0A8J4PJI9_9MYCE|nr:hypothetical protein CYY_009936 [Polysphondylium violaceum]
MDTLFFSVWRNTVFRRYIRILVCENLVINVDLQYLNDNHQYMSLLSDQERLDNNIYFKLLISTRDELNEYNDNPHKHLIDDIEHSHFNLRLNYNVVPAEENYIDCDKICDGVRRLLIYADENTRVRGKLPQSITEFNLNGDDDELYYMASFRNREIDAMVSGLPNLRKLVLPDNFSFANKVELPSFCKSITFSMK